MPSTVERENDTALESMVLLVLPLRQDTLAVTEMLFDVTEGKTPNDGSTSPKALPGTRTVNPSARTAATTAVKVRGYLTTELAHSWDTFAT